MYHVIEHVGSHGALSIITQQQFDNPDPMGLGWDHFGAFETLEHAEIAREYLYTNEWPEGIDDETFLAVYWSFAN